METKKKKIELKRLIADIPLIVHNQIKINATMRNMSIRQYIILATMEQMRKDREYQ